MSQACMARVRECLGVVSFSSCYTVFGLYAVGEGGGESQQMVGKPVLVLAVFSGGLPEWGHLCT